MSALETIIRTESSGSTWTLYGRKSRKEWQFHAELEERIDFPYPGACAQTVSREFRSWAEAIEAFDRYPWFRFHPIHVAAAFRPAVWSALQSRWWHIGHGPDVVDQWRQVCACNDE